jgi:hypothetical protein
MVRDEVELEFEKKEVLTSLYVNNFSHNSYYTLRFFKKKKKKRKKKEGEKKISKH